MNQGSFWAAKLRDSLVLFKEFSFIFTLWESISYLFYWILSSNWPDMRDYLILQVSQNNPYYYICHLRIRNMSLCAYSHFRCLFWRRSVIECMLRNPVRSHLLTCNLMIRKEDAFRILESKNQSWRWRSHKASEGPLSLWLNTFLNWNIYFVFRVHMEMYCICT